MALLGVGPLCIWQMVKLRCCGYPQLLAVQQDLWWGVAVIESAVGPGLGVPGCYG